MKIRMATVVVAALAAAGCSSATTGAATTRSPARPPLQQRYAAFTARADTLLPDGLPEARIRKIGDGICLELSQTHDGGDASALVQSTLSISGHHADQVARAATRYLCPEYRRATR